MSSKKKSTQTSGPESQLEFTFQSDALHPEVLTAAIRAHGQSKGLNPVQLHHLEAEFIEAYARTIIHHQSLNQIAKLSVSLHDQNGKFAIELANHGAPFFGIFSRHSQFSEISRTETNMGRAGQRFRWEVRAPNIQSGQILQLRRRGRAQGPVKVRRAESHEMPRLAQLFHKVYQYDYINEDVYFPDRMTAKLNSGEFVSFVATDTTGAWLGHVGLKRWNTDPLVYEPCLGLVDPTTQSTGVFSALFRDVMTYAKESQAEYLIIDFVTNHLLTQKFVAPFGSLDTALFLGCQTKETQANLERLGLGENPEEMDRYSLLYSIVPLRERPFGTEIELPGSVGSLLEPIVTSLGLEYRSEPRFHSTEALGAFSETIGDIQQAVSFDMHEPGLKCTEDLLERWQELKRTGTIYASVDIPLGTVPIGQIYDRLREGGFFLSGLVPTQASRSLSLRLQSLAPTRVDLDSLQLLSPNAQTLREIIRTQATPLELV